jgi:2-keto-4-pentenoate hydratase
VSPASLAEAVAEARGSRNTIVAADTPDVESIEEAYGIQATQFGDRRLAGYKLGLISPAKQRQMGLSSPAFGRVADDMILDREVRIADFIQPKAEPELALVLRTALPAGATVGMARNAVGGAFLAVDILDSVWADYKFSLTQVVADNTSGGGFLIGDRLVDREGEGRLRLFIDGELRSEGSTDALAGTDENLARLATAVGGLQAGCLVFAGSPVAAVPVGPGLLEVVGPGGSLLSATLE